MLRAVLDCSETNTDRTGASTCLGANLKYPSVKVGRRCAAGIPYILLHAECLNIAWDTSPFKTNKACLGIIRPLREGYCVLGIHTVGLLQCQSNAVLPSVLGPAVLNPWVRNTICIYS